jgi:hypothetical protein
MDRNYRNTIGADMRRDCRKVIKQIQTANARMGKKRIRRIEKIRQRVGQIEVAIRICADGRLGFLIGRDQQAALIELTQSIGKQATGWKQQTENALARGGAKVAPSMRS